MSYPALQSHRCRLTCGHELFHFLVKIKHPLLSEIPNGEGQTKNIYASVFARSILIPKKIFLDKIKTSSLKGSLNQELAKLFWVSPTLINQSLKEVFTEQKR